MTEFYFENMVQDVDPGHHFDPNIQTEEIAFRPSEMIACSKCRRTNPPNRLDCLYCGGPLEFKTDLASEIRLNLRTLEPWELGWNIISRADPGTKQPEYRQIALLLEREADSILEQINSSMPLPIARVESLTKAELLADRLSNLGLICSIVSDADLKADTLPVRLKRIEFDDVDLGLENFNTGELKTISAANLVLIVKGRLISSRSDKLERKRRRGNTRLLDESSTMNDETVVDLYSRGDGVGYRVRQTGFDFSCIGIARSLLASENMGLLLDQLKRVAPDAMVVDGYNNISRLLDSVWELESRNDPQGLQRVGLGKREFATVATTNNLSQFTKFSRLQWHLL